MQSLGGEVESSIIDSFQKKNGSNNNKYPSGDPKVISQRVKRDIEMAVRENISLSVGNLKECAGVNASVSTVRQGIKSKFICKKRIQYPHLTINTRKTGQKF